MALNSLELLLRVQSHEAKPRPYAKEDHLSKNNEQLSSTAWLNTPVLRVLQPRGRAISTQQKTRTRIVGFG
eukprot:250645-Amphidinium_carterae.1